MSLDQVKVIAFDADDTLWVNETLFRDAEIEFCRLMEGFMEEGECQQQLFDLEMKNLPLYGYGIKPFTLSLVEAAIQFSNGKVSNEILTQIIDIGKQMLEAPVDLIDGIEDTLEKLTKKYRLVVATKGDLLDQQRKLVKSGLEPFFHHIEVMPDKQPFHYTKLVNHLDIAVDQFLMVGNSVKSDILPVLEIGAHAFHIPFHTTWAHEVVNDPVEHPNFKLLAHSSEMMSLL